MTEHIEPLLSICIPTYNRASTLNRLLDSIIIQLAQETAGSIEIIISDNNSDDNTADIVARFSKSGVSITYVRNDENIGFGRNLTQAISKARGKYCWLIGSDDVSHKNSLNIITNCIRSNHPDIVIGSAITNGKKRPFIHSATNLMFIHSNAEVIRYLDICTEFSAMFAFMSAIIVRREFWINAPSAERFTTHPYCHTMRIFSSICTYGASIYHIKEPVVITGDEPNDYSAHIAKHFLLDLKTLISINHEFFDCDIDVLRALGRVFKKQYKTRKLLCARFGLPQSEWADVVETLEKFKYGKFLTKKTALDEILSSAYIFAKRLKNGT